LQQQHSLSNSKNQQQQWLEQRKAFKSRNNRKDQQQQRQGRGRANDDRNSGESSGFG
jgi:hypothetical protein